MATKSDNKAPKTPQSNVEYVGQKLEASAKQITLAVNKILREDELRQHFELETVQELNAIANQLQTLGLNLSWGKTIGQETTSEYE